MKVEIKVILTKDEFEQAKRDYLEFNEPSPMIDDIIKQSYIDQVIADKHEYVYEDNMIVMVVEVE